MRTILLMSVEAASGRGSGPGSTTRTFHPRAASVSADATPITPAPAIVTLLLPAAIREILRAGGRRAARDDARAHPVAGSALGRARRGGRRHGRGGRRRCRVARVRR